MLCDDCKQNTAAVHITQIANNQKVDKHLCNHCAKKYGNLGFSLNSQVSVHDFLKNMFSPSAIEPAPKGGMACKNCGMTYQDFSRSGKFGCSVCYSSFGNRIEPLLRRIHGGTAHTGKIPRRTGGELEIRQRLKKLRHDLERHIGREEYEQAAQVRDQIRIIEKEQEQSGKGEQ